MPNKEVIAITTFNRMERLKALVNSIKKYGSSNYKVLIIADDGSTDGTIEYVRNLKIPNTQTILLENNRQGIHHQFNTIVRKLEDMTFDYCFKCDDDIEFIKKGWEKLYIDAIERTSYHHLCYFDPAWRVEKNFGNPVVRDGLMSYCLPKDVQGAFFTLTPKVIKEVGYMDIENFGFRGVGHVDYTMRSCRAGFNDIKHPFDVADSNQYIKHQTLDYQSALDRDIQNAMESDEETRRKYELIKNKNRIHIPFNINTGNLTTEDEIDLLKKRIKALEDAKRWYEKTYSHQPRWFVRLGKIIGLAIKPLKWPC